MKRDHLKSFELDVAQGLQIDEVCTRFEQQLRAGQEPRIETFLTDDAEPFRSHLLTSLLQLEFEYRSGTDRSFDIRGYIERFPQDRSLIQTVYDEQEQMPSVSSRYQIVEKLGQGGMGVVYLADDRTLNRKVALKFLAESLEHHPNAQERLLREARAAAAIDHPFVCSIHEVGEADGKTFIAMEYVTGETLKDRLQRGPVPLQQAISIALEICEALTSAHEYGIIHRDLKPGNIMLTRDGHAKVMDFGLAKRVDSTHADVNTVTNLTRPGETPGSPAYMSPEQLAGATLDARSDVFSFAIVICEMFGGVHPFKNDSSESITKSILIDSPRIQVPVSTRIEPRLKSLLECMLEKDSEQRPKSIAEVHQELQRLQSKLIAAESNHIVRVIERVVSRPQFYIPAAIILCMTILIGHRVLDQNTKRRWARHEGIREIRRLVDREDYRAAFSLAETVEQHIPEEPELVALWPEISNRLSVTSVPEDAQVFLKDYAHPRDPWKLIGQTPIAEFRVSKTSRKRLRLNKRGYRMVEMSVGPEENTTVTLRETGADPQDMIFVRGSSGDPQDYADRLHITGLGHSESVFGDFVIDRFEVTNEQYSKFVAEDGYGKRAYWKHKFIKDGRELTWEDAMLEFRDETGRPGPETWKVGRYPEGQEHFPVRGISWYEAAAYAEFAGKQLPTIYHWCKSASTWTGADMIPLSNFGESGPAPVGHHEGISWIGAYDMAGNVKEWCWNSASESESRRYILGGAWNEAEYMFHDPDSRSPFDRSDNFGFRCMKYLADDELSAEVLAPIVPPIRDYANEQPMSKQEFDIHAQSFEFDRGNLQAELVTTETAKHWTKQKVSINAAYGGERMTVYLFLPNDTAPPYQPIVYFPASWAMRRPSSANLEETVDFIVLSGRSLCCPVYRSTYERREEHFHSDRPEMSSNFKNHVVCWYQDFARCVEYLETRDDFDKGKLGYYGESWGAAMGAIIPAIEKRIKACVLVDGGFWRQRGPDGTEQIDFAPRVTVPVLMLNGRYDHVFPVESSQAPMYRLLGTPTEQKKHIIVESGHGFPRNLRIKESLEWFDTHLGSIE